MTRTFLPHVITDDSALGGKIIEKSLRFNGQHESTAPQLRRTGTTTSSSFTISMWAKVARTTDQYKFFFSIGQENDANAAWVGLLDGSAPAYNTIGFQGGNGTYTTSTKGFRDLSSWFHFLISVNSNNFTVYIDGESIKTGTIRSLDTSTNGIRIGANYGSYYPWNGYLADVYLIDGQAKLPTDFAYTESQTGIWRPKHYTGTFGTGGAHLEFKDSSSVAALGKDTSGNGNDFTPTTDGFNVSSGLGNDSFEDTPTNNFPTLNPNHAFLNGSSSTAENGNLQWNGQSNKQAGCPATMAFPKTGKWYWEVKLLSSNSNFSFGITPVTYSNVINPSSPTGSIGYAAYGSKIVSGSETASWAASFSNSDTAAAALDMENKSITFYKNNSAVGTINLVSGYENVNYLAWIKGDTASQLIQGAINFGGNGFVYTPPTGFKALNSNNLVPHSPLIIRPQKHFDTLLYTGNDSSDRNIEGLEFKPDMVWIKNRDQNDFHVIQDSVRGANKILYPNDTDNEQTDNANGHVNYFTSGGFNVSVGSAGLVNSNGEDYVAWCWKAGGAAVSNTDGSVTSQVSVNQKAGFSIVTYSGSNDSTVTFGHGLGASPKWVWIKRRSGGSGWRVYNADVGTGSYLSTINSNASVSSAQDFASVSSTTFGVKGGYNPVSASGETYVAYCWTDIPGYSKFGSYTGNGSSEGTFVHLGFRPAFLMVKKTSGANSWVMFDAKRSTTNIIDNYLIAEGADVDNTNSAVDVDFLSNGVKFRSGYDIVNAGDYIYMAFAEQPGGTAFDTFPNAR